jgi:hypothetical protein
MGVEAAKFLCMGISTPPEVLRGKALTASVDVRKLPKVLLHELLDGGLRPATVIDLAAEIGDDGLPTTDATDLAKWFPRRAQRGNLPSIWKDSSTRPR